jgi:hypothetical protein
MEGDSRVKDLGRPPLLLLMLTTEQETDHDLKVDMVVNTCNLSTWEAEAGRL